jgi:small-conductance mechanosensitive channel
MTSEGGTIAFVATAQKTVAATMHDLVAAPGEAGELALRWSGWLQTGDGVRAFADVLVLFVIAGGLEWLYWTYALPAWRDAEAADPASRWEALRLGLRRLLIGGLAVVLSLLALVAASTAFQWPPGVQDVVVTVGVGITLVRLVALMANVVLAPRAPRLRLVRMRNPAASSLARWLVAGTSVLAAGLLLPDLAERVGGAMRVGAAIRALTVLSMAGFLLAAVSALDRAARARVPAPSPVRRPRSVPRPFLALLWIVAVLVLWAGGLERWAWTLVIVSATLVAESFSRRVVRTLWTLREEERVALAREAEPDVAPLPDAAFSILPDLTLRLARFVVALAGGLAVAFVWGIPAMELSNMESPQGRIVSRILGALAVLLVADLAWAALRGAIDGRLERIARTSGGHDPETGSNARLITLLPLARKASGVVLAVLVTLSVLSIFGVEITPLLAGAGVVGIAVGFGAQTLVRDVLSGVFYLVEDVFRIGDYIEGGGSAKGTVERITLRTVALRHQNGPLHFVPYGVLGAVRNNSRDWVVDKFEIPLPVDVDSEFVRKTVKKIGQQMLEDPALAAVIVEPLKAKLYRIVPGAKIFRCKVQTPPGRQFEVRSEAYKRIEAALREAGIRFADVQAQVIVQGGGGPAPAEPAVRPAPAGAG